MATDSTNPVSGDERVGCLACGARDAEPVLESPAQMAETGEVFRFVRCRACGLIYLSPRVSVAQIGRFYDETYLPHRGASAWGRYAPTVAWAQQGTDRARARVVRRALGGRNEARRVLDVGCGQPTFLRRLVEETGMTGVGVDFSDEGWRHEPTRWEGLELHHGTLAEVKLAPGFEVITLWHALEHEYDPLDTLKRLRALASPGATLVVEVPNFDSLTRRLQGAHWAGLHTPRHTAAYTPGTLRAMLERAGWRVESLTSYGTFDPWVLFWLGWEEQRGRSLRGSLERRFVPFLAGKAVTWPLAALHRWISLGVQTAIARAD